jgi:hypothetical protein
MSTSTRKKTISNFNMVAITTIAKKFHECCYDGVRLAEQLLTPEGFERSDIMTKFHPNNYVVRLAIFRKGDISVILNYSDHQDEVVVFTDENSSRNYIGTQQQIQSEKAQAQKAKAPESQIDIETKSHILFEYIYSMQVLRWLRDNQMLADNNRSNEQLSEEAIKFAASFQEHRDWLKDQLD